MKQILIIGINYAPELTGIGKYTAEFASFLANQSNNTVTVITGNPYYPQWKVYDGYKNAYQKNIIENVAVYRSPLYIPTNPSGSKRLLQDALFFTTSFIIVTLLLIRRKKFDVVFIPVPSFLLGLLGLYYRFFFPKTKVVYHIQDLQIDAAENLQMIKSKMLLNFLYSIERYILRKVDYVSTISEGMKSKILAKTAKLKGCLIFPNWINSKNIYPIIPAPLLSQKYLNNKKVVFYSGAIGEKQGLELVIDTAFELREIKDLVFVISGEGPYKEKLITYAQAKNLENVFFLNLLPINDFNRLLNAAHIHLVIQKESGSDLFLPSKLTNILGVGGCVVVTASEGTSLHSIIHNNDCGYIIPSSNLEALSDAIHTLINNPSLHQKFKDNAFKYAEKYLYQTSITNNFLAEIDG